INVKPDYFKSTDLFSKERLENIKNTFLSLIKSKRRRILHNIKKDIDLIEEMLHDIKRIRNLERRDEKIKKLIEILEKEKKPTIIFSESRDTVIYIGRKLREHGKFKFEMAYGGEAPIDEETGEKVKVEIRKEDIEKKFNNGEFDILISTDIMSEGVNLSRADVIINFDLHYNPVRLIQRDGRAIRINNPKKITIYNFRPDERIDKELELCDRLAERVENIIATIGLDFLIWSLEEKKISELSEKNRKRIIELIREYKDLLANKTPEELKKSIPPTLSREDKILREFIKFWGISEETIESRAKKYTKPIYTGLKKTATKDYFIAFKYRGSIYTIGELSFSKNPIQKKLDRDEIKKIEELVAEKCLELDAEFLRVSQRRKDKSTTEIEKIIEEIEDLKDIFRDIDLSTMPKKYRAEILRQLKKVKDAPPWKRNEKIKELKKILQEKINIREYQRSLERPQVLAVIKYG
ncbi:MAG: hypothetical protein J7K36_02395, partial [Archaeoglobaceae archaeon]|nr:hypothetical protein [Archaeoglobaceae archaeon]